MHLIGRGQLIGLKGLNILDNSKDPELAYVGDKCLKDLKEGKGACSQQISLKYETDLWFWDYAHIKDALSNLKKCSLNMGSTIVDEIILNVADTIKTLFKTGSELSSEISKYWLSKSFIINRILPLTKKISKPNFQTKILHNCSAKNRLEDQIYCMDHFNSVRRYSWAFDEILSGIMYKDWAHGDIAFLISRSDSRSGKHYCEHVKFIEQGINYDETTKKEYEHMFRELEETLINVAKGIVC